MKTAAEQEVYGMANKTADKRVEFRVSLSDDQTEAASWSIADIDLIRNQLEREIYCITSKDKMRFKKELSIQLLEFEAWGQEIGVWMLQKTIEQSIVHFGCPKMHLVSHISDSIGRMGSGDNFPNRYL